MTPPFRLPKWHPGCAIRGHHTRDQHKRYCRPAIDAAFAAYKRDAAVPR